MCDPPKKTKQSKKLSSSFKSLVVKQVKMLQCGKEGHEDVCGGRGEAGRGQNRREFGRGKGVSVDQLRVQEEVKNMAEMSKKLLRAYKVVRLHPLHASQDDLNLGFKSRNTPALGVFIYHSKYKHRPHSGLHERTYVIC